jgi:hypothetical protein
MTIGSEVFPNFPMSVEAIRNLIFHISILWLLRICAPSLHLCLLSGAVGLSYESLTRGER